MRLTSTSEIWAERRQVAFIVAAGALLLFGLWFVILRPSTRHRLQLQRDIETISAQLAETSYLIGEDSLRTRKLEEELFNKRLVKQWERMASALATFKGEPVGAGTGVGHIDFKVALYEVRQRLRRMSRATGISFQGDLGMDEKISNQGDTRKLMLQLRTVEKLADLAFRLEVKRLLQIEPFAPIEYSSGGETATFLEEYPVRLRFQGTAANLHQLLKAILQPDTFLVLRDLQIQRLRDNSEGLLDISTVLSALVFVKGPNELGPVAIERIGPVSPRGY